jgi:pimeloyl-ACP methyl ester carboxylesterase
MATVRKGFVALPHGDVHFRYAGQGPTVVLLHDSPRSSVLHAQNLEWLGEDFTVIALDTPGYGNSAALPVAEPDIADFSRALAEALTALGIERCALYGFHSGAKIALQFAVDHPQRAALTLVDGLSLPAQAPPDDFLRVYLMPFTPTVEGDYIVKQWSKLLDFHRYYPWFMRWSCRTTGACTSTPPTCSCPAPHGPAPTARRCATSRVHGYLDFGRRRSSCVARTT